MFFLFQVKNTPAGGTITIKFSKKIIDENGINNYYLSVEFSYISALLEDEDEDDNNNTSNSNNNKDFNVVIFDPNKPVVNKNDSGMDLWIANKIIEAHM